MILSINDQIKFTLIALGVGPLLVLVGVWLTLTSLHAQETWEPAQAKVTQAESYIVSSVTSGKSWQSYRFRFFYSVDGKQYSGENVDHGLVSNFFSVGKRWAGNKYPVGTDIKVFYDPQRPHRSVLSNGVCVEGPMETIFGCMLVIGAVINLKRLNGIKVSPTEAPTDRISTIDQTIDKGCDERETAIQDWLDKRESCNLNA